MIVTPTARISAAGTVTVAAIATMIGQAPFPEIVELPSDPAGHPETRLKRPSEVVCTWLADVAVSAVQDSGGYLPPDVLAAVLEKVGRLN